MAYKDAVFVLGFLFKVAIVHWFDKWYPNCHLRNWVEALDPKTKNPPAEADGSIELCCEPDQNSIRTFIVARSARLMVSTDMMSTGTLNA